MRTVIVGGGPGGLFLAVLLKRARPSDEVVVLERNRPDDTFGFGVVFSDKTMATLAEYDRVTAGALQEGAPQWTDIEVRHSGSVLRCGGHGFTAIARKRLLMLLQQQAHSLDVDLRFATDVREVADVGDYDLLVGADGQKSVVRSWFSEHFGPAADVGEARFMWCGTTKRFDCLTFPFERNEHGAFGIHAYPYDSDMSTFLVETDESSWRAAGLDRHEGEAHPPGWNDDASIDYFADLFAEHLDGAELIGNNSQWQQFRTLRNTTWRYGNAALLGDAAHTAHFSVGSGTKMAMEDAGELARALHETPETETALARYEARRRPAVEHIQHLSEPSLGWWERFGRLMHLEPEQFTFNFLTRTPRLTLEGLRQRDPDLVGGIEQWWKRNHMSGAAAHGGVALDTPLRLRGLELSNRLVIEWPRQGTDAGDDAVSAATAEAERWGAGTLLAAVHPADPWTPAVAERWRKVGAGLHHHGGVALGLQLAHDDGELVPRASALSAGGIRLLEIAVEDWSIDELADLVALTGRVRQAIGDDAVLSLRLPAVDRDGNVQIDACVELGEAWRGEGVDVVAVARDAAGVVAVGDWRHLLLSERLRTEAGVATMFVDGAPDEDEANTAILAARTDLCVGRPTPDAVHWAGREDAP